MSSISKLFISNNRKAKLYEDLGFQLECQKMKDWVEEQTVKWKLNEIVDFDSHECRVKCFDFSNEKKLWWDIHNYESKIVVSLKNLMTL